MARIVMEFSPDITGKDISDFDVTACVRIASAGTVSASGMTMTEIADGVYIVANPNVVSDTFLKLTLKSDNAVTATGIFSVSDDNIAQQDTLASISGLSLDELTEQRIRLLDNLANLDARISSVLTGKVYVPVKTGASTVDTVSSSGKQIKYKDGSELVIGS